MTLTEETLFKVEKTLLDTLVSLLQKQKISIDEGKKITATFLALRPFTSMEDLKTKLHTFTTTYPDFLMPYVVFLQQEDSQIHAPIITQMEALIKSNKIAEALALAEPLWKTDNSPELQKPA